MSATTWKRRSARGGGSARSRRSTGSATKSASDNNVALSAELLSRKRDVFPWLNRSWAVNAQLVTLPHGPDSRMSSPMNGAGDGGGDAPPSLIAELDARPAAAPRAPRALVFDSGLGGLSVLAEIRRLRP